MTAADRDVRAGRSRAPVVAVTGAAGALGSKILSRLLASSEVARVVAIDVDRPVSSSDDGAEGVTWRIADVRDPALASKLTGVDVVVHAAVETAVEAPAVERRALNVRGTTVVLTAAAAAGVQRVVVVTSAMVYGARADQAAALSDDAPVRACPDESVLGDWVEMEELAERARRVHPWLEVTVLRPATLVGVESDSIVSRHFDAPRLLVLDDAAPRWQFCHADDLVAAVELAALGLLPASVNVASPGSLSQADAERISGLRPVRVPAALARTTIERLHRLGVTPAAPTELDFLSHPWVVATSALSAAGWQATWDNEAALQLLLDETAARKAGAGHRVDRGDAARAAAGATVALVGTAALVRRARKRRHG